MADQARNPWRERDFLKLWLGETVSQLGSQITTLALPLTAVLILQVTPVQVGALAWILASPLPQLQEFPGTESAPARQITTEAA